MTHADLLDRIRLDLRIVAEHLIDHGKRSERVQRERLDLDIELDRIAEEIVKLTEASDG